MRTTDMTDDTQPRRTPPTEAQKQVSRNIRKIWDAKKKELGLSQIQAAKKLDLTQPSFNQYLNGAVVPNHRFVLRYAKLMGVDATAIDPSINEYGLVILPRQKLMKIPILGSLGGPAAMPHITTELGEREQHKILAAVPINTNEYPELAPEQCLIVDMERELKERFPVIFRRVDSALFEYGKIVSVKPLMIAHGKDGSIDEYKPKDFATGPFVVSQIILP